jgi:hypothetical protein
VRVGIPCGERKEGSRRGWGRKMEEEKAGEGNGEKEFILFLLAVVGRGLEIWRDSD